MFYLYFSFLKIEYKDTKNIPIFSDKNSKKLTLVTEL